jgi:signal transduction histidine kinase/ActR/RegA family two-component response regulator
MKISIRWALITGLLITIWGLQVVTVTSSFLTSQQVLLRHARDIMDNISEFAMEQAHHHLDLAQGAAHLTKRLITAEVVSSESGRVDALKRYFFDQLAIYPHFAGIYFGMPNGNFYYVSRYPTDGAKGFRTKVIQEVNGQREVRLYFYDGNMRLVKEEVDPNDSYDPRQRPWYIKAKNQKKIVWTDPYVFFTSQKPGITIAGPVYRDQNRLQGIVGVDIEIDQLSTFMAKLRIGKNGRAFMLNRNMDVVAFPDLSKITMENAAFPGRTRLVKITEIDDPLSFSAFSAVQWEQTPEGKLVIDAPQFSQFRHDGEEYDAMFTPFPDKHWPWVIGVYLPENDYLGEIKGNRRFNIMVTIGVSAVATIAALLFAGSIIRPVAELEREAQSIRQQNLEPSPPVKTAYNEIQETADSFATMKSALREHAIEKEQLENQIRHSQKMEAIGTLAGGVAHDFNNILYPIIGYTEMTLDELPEGGTARENLKEILTAAKRARLLVEQILTFSRQDPQGRIPIKLQPLLEESLALLRATLPSTITIRQEIDEDVGPVFADPTQLQQVVMNLCTNAFHAMQSHGGTLTVALRAVPGGIAPSPDDDTDRRSEALMLSISDTGSGMSQETLDRVFEPYFTTKRPGEGTGMGLAVVHGIVTGHGGTIDVHSKPGIGTQIDILLPRTQKMVDEQHFGAREAKGGREKVIVVDDEEQIVRMQEQMLNQLGYRVTAFTDSISALERFDDSPYSFDVVLTDLTMPKLTGDRLAREMLKIRPDIPIILCTGFSELIDEKTAHEMGIRKLLFKPVVKAELADALRDALDTDRA